MPKLPRLFPVLLTGSGLLLAVTCAAATLPDFSGIWRLNDQQSDSADQIAASLRAERKREDAKAQLPASTSSTSTLATSGASGSHGGHGGAHGMGGMGGGHGRGGSRSQNKAGSSDGTSPIVDTPPPLLANDSILNIQQDSKHMQVALSDSDRLDARLDGIAQQSLNGIAVVQTRAYADGLSIVIQFDGGTHLDEHWVKSADGHHLTVTEQWTSPTVRQPVVFRRRYDRLDI